VAENYDKNLRERLDFINGMGTTASAFASQLADKTLQVKQQEEAARQQKLAAAAQAKWQAAQAAALAKQQKAYLDQLKNIRFTPPVAESTTVPSVPTTSAPVGGGTTGGSPMHFAPSKGNTFENFRNAIIGQESGGVYSKVNKSSGALGKYQVMPINVASWSKAALGYSVTPAQYLHSPQIQDAVASHQLQQYYSKWGPAGAAVAWYAGPRTASNYVRNPSGYNKKQGAYPSINAYAMSVLKRMGIG